MKMSYEELFSEIQTLRKEISKLKSENRQLREENRQLREENTQLKERLKLNSKNSSKPPSTDQISSKKSTKSGGAKPGHPGHFRPFFPKEQVDAFISLEASSCPTCGGSVREVANTESIHQQVEIAPKPFIVTQYNRKKFYCPCCRKYGVAPLPKRVGSSSFGTRLSAFMGYLTGYCRLSRRNALNILKEGFQLRVAVGSQSNVEERLSLALESNYAEIEREVRESKETKHVDETGWKRSGKREFVWILSTASAAYYKIQAGRGSSYRDNLLGSAAQKRVPFVTDRYAVYCFKGPHQYCLAHLKRDIKRFAQRTNLDGEWGEVMLGYLKRIFELWKEHRQGNRTQRSFRRSSRRYRDDFEYGLLTAAVKSRHSPSLQRFARGLLRKTDNLWIFATHDEVDPTNNQAERDLRGIVIGRKISYGSKSERGSRFIERINSVVTTLKRQKQGSLGQLVAALDAWKTDQKSPPIFTGTC